MLEANNLTVSMSRRGNYHDNACAESFFTFLKREGIRCRIYLSREEGKADIFKYIELFKIQHEVMVIITCRKWSSRRTIL